MSAYKAAAGDRVCGIIGDCDFKMQMRTARLSYIALQTKRCAGRSSLAFA